MAHNVPRPGGPSGDARAPLLSRGPPARQLGLRAADVLHRPARARHHRPCRRGACATRGPAGRGPPTCTMHTHKKRACQPGAHAICCLELVIVDPQCRVAAYCAGPHHSPEPQPPHQRLSQDGLVCRLSTWVPVRAHFTGEFGIKKTFSQGQGTHQHHPPWAALCPPPAPPRHMRGRPPHNPGRPRPPAPG